MKKILTIGLLSFGLMTSGLLANGIKIENSSQINKSTEYAKTNQVDDSTFSVDGVNNILHLYVTLDQNVQTEYAQLFIGGVIYDYSIDGYYYNQGDIIETSYNYSSSDEGYYDSVMFTIHPYDTLEPEYGYIYDVDLT